MGRKDSVTVLFSGGVNPVELFAAPKGKRAGGLPTISSYKELNTLPDADSGMIPNTTMYALAHSESFKNTRGFREPKTAQTVNNSLVGKPRTAPTFD